MIDNKPLISIITPVYNGEKYIEDCILSIKNQTYTNFEHIIMDGGSSDDTVEKAEKYLGSYNLKIYSEKDKGMYDAVRKGFEKSNGEIMAWLNSDDMYHKWTLDIVSKVFTKKNIHWCTGHPGFWNENGDYRLLEILPVYSRKMIKNGYYDGRFMYNIQQESTFWSRELWNKSSKLPLIKYSVAGDYHLWREFAKYAELYSINAPLAGFRIHDGQKSNVQRVQYYREVGDLNIIKRIILKTNILKLYQKIVSVFSKNRKIFIQYFD